MRNKLKNPPPSAGSPNGSFLSFFPSTQKQTAVTKAPNPSLLSFPAPEGHQTALSCLHPPTVSFPSTHQSTIISNVSPCEHQTQNKDVLLPPSAFMTTGTKDMVIITCSISPDISNVIKAKLTNLTWASFFQKLGKSNCSGFGDASLHQFVPPFEHSSAHSGTLPALFFTFML